jgi:glycosyltransferase involved in cell wall biosynthesis
MRILIVNKTFHPWYSAAAKYVFYLTKYFIAKGHEVHLLVTSYLYDIPKVTPHIVKPLINKEPYRSASITLKFSLYSLLNNLKYDIIHSQGLNCFIGMNIITAHAFKSLQDKIVKGSYDFKDYFMERLVFNQAKVIIAPSNLAKKSLVKFYKIPEDKIRVVYHGVDIEEFSPATPSERQNLRKNGVNDDSFVILFIGEFKRKNLDDVLMALSKLNKNIKLIVVGGKRAGGKTYYMKMIEHLKLTSRVLFYDFVSQKQLLELYKISDVYILPTLYDTFGLTVLEAMAVGLPVIVSRRAGVSELLLNTSVEEYFILNEISAEGIRKRLELLMSDETLRRKLGLIARKIAEKWTWQKTAEETLKIYEEVVKVKGGSAVS